MYTQNYKFFDSVILQGYLREDRFMVALLFLKCRKALLPLFVEKAFENKTIANNVVFLIRRLNIKIKEDKYFKKTKQQKKKKNVFCGVRSNPGPLSTLVIVLFVKVN